MHRTETLGYPVFAGYSGDQLRSALVFLTFAVSFVVYIEPAPVDLMFLLLFAFFWRSGLSGTLGASTLTLLLVLYNLGGFFAAIPVSTKPFVMMFIITSAYMGLSAIFVAYFVAHDPVNRMRLIRLGWIVGGVLAAICGMIDYLEIGGIFPNSIIKGRATGTFKDPNVFSTYLIFPGLLLMQGLMLGTTKLKTLSLVGLVIIVAGVFFSFSRGAWANFVFASSLMVLLTFVVNAEYAMRQRILLFFISAVVAGAVAFALLMTIEPVRDLFFERFTLLQRYDSGETGRFGNQLRSIPELMTLPLGYGPQQFFNHYGLDPHNTFINAFSSYGWLGGISYLLLFFSSIIVGIKSVLTKSPWQNYAIVVFCPMFTTLMQGVQIDMDHWRHLYWLIGMNWGLYAATLQPASVVGGFALIKNLFQEKPKQVELTSHAVAAASAPFVSVAAPVVKTATTQPMPQSIHQFIGFAFTARWRTWLVSMIFISSFFVKFEPAPGDLFFALALLFCIGSGLRLTVTIIPLFLLLLLYNLSTFVSYITIPYDMLDSKAFLIGLVYTTASSVFFAAYVAAEPTARFKQIIRAYWIGATIGAALGLVSYFKIEPLYAYFPDFGGRAVGGFKDPNVFSTWLVLPAVTMLQGFMLGTLRVRPLPLISFLMIFAALFLAFSRGAWINVVMAMVIMISLTFALSPSNGLRTRISLAAIIGIGCFAVLLVILLSMPTTRDLFLDRFTLVKSYDSGERGRFGNQLNSIPYLFRLPLGFGPYQFGGIFGEAPHNTFLNSFASGGWLGGIVYILFTVSNMIVGVKTCLVRTPFQPYAIAVFSCLIAVTFQGVQIDTEHWRHFYWMTGILWGFFAASFYYLHTNPTRGEIAEGWNLTKTAGAF